MSTYMKKLEVFLEIGGTKKDVTLLSIGGLSLLASLFGWNPLPFDIAWIAIVLCGLPIILEAIISLITEFDIKADVLVSIALIASVCIGEHFAAGEVAFIMQLGALLEDLTVAKARAGIEKLVQLTPQTARVITTGVEHIVKATDVKVNDLIRVLPGETIPVDGMIVSGQTSVNQAVMTGESIPVDKSLGDEVCSGTVNQFGVFEMKATKVGADSSIQRMIQLVQSADAKKAKIVGIADRWATWIVVIALSAATLTWFISGEIIRAVTILVVFCPCSLVLATPTAIMAAIGNVTKHGFLVREGDALERLSKVSKIAFDKTGTLTVGTPMVTKVHSIVNGKSELELYRLVASLERLSEHPLGKAIARSYQSEYGVQYDHVSNFNLVAGQGVTGVIHDKTILVGNEKLIQEYCINISQELLTETEEFLEQGSTCIYVAIENEMSGYIVLTDTLRTESRSMVEMLQTQGITPILLTGDHKSAAKQIASNVGIEEVYYECLPEDKMKYIEDSQKMQCNICMIGDGINDAPALKQSFVGIAMGGIGSDIAVDAADIVLSDEEVKELTHLFSLSKKMMKTIKINLVFSMILNFVAIILAMTGVLNPVIGALVHNAGSVMVIINSAILLIWRKKDRKKSGVFTCIDSKEIA